ncbi:MAG: hypothetical protein IKC12_04765 [Alistipes sp.]|nr:hypothetical protein [Alistipes sp.]
MRKLFTTLKSVVAVAIVASMALASSCSYDDTAIKNRVDQVEQDVDKVEKDLAALTERVTALENKLKSDVEALTELINNKAVVTNLTTDADGVTTVELSNGKSFKVYPECTVEDTDTDTNTYIGIKADEDGVLYFAVFEMGNFKEWLTIEGEKVPVYDGDTQDDNICDGGIVDTDTNDDTYVAPYLNEEDGEYYYAVLDRKDNNKFVEWYLVNGEKVAVYDGNDDTICECKPVEIEFRVNADTKALEFTIDGGTTWHETGLSAADSGAQLITNVIDNGNDTVTFVGAGFEFTVVKADLIEFNSTRGQLYVKAGETKDVYFTINTAVADVNVMNQPLGWKAEVALAPVTEEGEGEGDEVDPGMGILAVGGTELVLKITGPSQEFLNAGFAEKEGEIVVHFNGNNGTCQVGKIAVELAEIKLDVDKAGNVTIVNTLVDTYEYTDWWGNSELISEFNNYYLAVMPLDSYNEDLESIYNANWGEFNVPCAGGWITNFYMNLNDRNQPTYYEEGVTESWTVVATVEEIIDYLDWYDNLTYEGESFMVLVIPTDVNNNGTLLLDQALAAPFKQLNINVVEIEDNRKFNNAYFDVTLRGGLAYNLFPMAVAEIQEYIDMEYYASVEEYFLKAMQQYVAQPQWSSFGFKVSTDVVEENIALMDLLGYTLDYAPYFAIEPNTEYVMAIFTEQEGKTEYGAEDLKYVYFSTADIVEATTPAEYTIEYNDSRAFTAIGVDITVPETTAVAYTRWYEEEYLDLAALKADLIENGYDRTDFEMGYTFSTSTTTNDADEARYLGLLIVNADGEYTLVHEKYTSKAVVYNDATLAIDKVEFPGDGTALVYFAGIDGLEIDYIKFYSSNLTNTSTYYKNLTQEELANISYSDDWLYRTANDNSNPVVIPTDVAYDVFKAGNTYKFALGVVFTDGTVSNCAYAEAEHPVPEGAFVPVRAEISGVGDGNSDYEAWLYDEAGNCLALEAYWDIDAAESVVSGTYTPVDGEAVAVTVTRFQEPIASDAGYYYFNVTASWDDNTFTLDAEKIAATVRE